jgi:hypothetical protein
MHLIGNSSTSSTGACYKCSSSGALDCKVKNSRVAAGNLFHSPLRNSYAGLEPLDRKPGPLWFSLVFNESDGGDQSTNCYQQMVFSQDLGLCVPNGGIQEQWMG